MNLLNKITGKSLILNKKRTIVTTIGILSVALLSAVSALFFSAIVSFRSFEVSEKGNFHVAFYDVDKEDIATFQNNKKVDKVFMVENIGYAKINSKNADKPYAYIKAFNSDALNNLAITLKEGRFPQNSREIVIPSHLKTNGRLDLKVGDNITLDVGTRIYLEDNFILDQSNPFLGTEDIIDTTKKTYKIVGIIERPASSMEWYEAPGYTFITFGDDINEDKADLYVRYNKAGLKDADRVTADLLGVDAEAWKMYGKYISGEISLDDAQQQKCLEEVDKAKYVFNQNDYLINLEVKPLEVGGIAGLGAVVVIVAIIIVFTSVFCIKNSFDISITEKIKQYGILRSIGATKKQIKKNVFYEAFILALIGIPLGIISGILAAYILIIVSNFFIGSSITGSLNLVFSMNIWCLVFAIILGVITIYLSAFRSAHKAAKIAPITAIRSNEEIKRKKIRGNKLVTSLFGIGGDISYKNLKRSKRKYRTTVISIIVSVATFIALSSFVGYGYQAVYKTYKSDKYNVYLSLSKLNNKDAYDQAMKTINLEGIKDYAIQRSGGIDVYNYQYTKEYADYLGQNINNNGSYDILHIVSVGNYQLKKYAKELGLNYDEIKDKGILYNRELCCSSNKCKSLDVYLYKKGDIIKYNDNKVIEVADVVSEAPFSLKTYDMPFLVVSDQVYEKIFDTNIVMFYYEASDAAKLQDNIEKMLGDSEYNLVNISEQVEMMNNLYTLVAIFLYGFIIVISLIGITNIFNTITTNMELRKKEFAMLKSIGMTKKEFNRMIRLESLLMGLKALIFGIPIGITLSYLIFKVLNEDNMLIYKLPIGAITIAILVVFILLFMIMKYAIGKINKQNIIETIRRENI